MLLLSYVLLLLGLSTLLTYFYFTRNFNYWKSRGVPYKKPVFFFGNLLHIIFGNETAGKYFESLYNQFEGPYLGFFAFNRPHLLLKDPDLIKRVLIKDFQIFQNRLPFSDEKVDPFMCNSLFGIKTPHWKLLRSKLSPVFTSGKLKMMMHLMKECGENLQRYVETTLNKNVEVKEIAAKYTTDIIMTCAFGITTNSFVNKNSEFCAAGRRIFGRSFVENLRVLSYFLAPEIVKTLKLRFFQKEPVEFLSRVFMETISERESKKDKRNDLIDILINLKNQEAEDDEFKFSGNRLTAQGIIFFAAGHETTSLTIAFTLHELCLNAEIQDRLREEILEVIEEHGDLTFEAVQNMKYLEMVVFETLRKYPISSFHIRECSEDYKIPETGLVIEKGTSLIISQYGLNWDPKYFQNPAKYDPERFNDENKQNIAPYVYLPFGDGPRRCIGERFGLLNTKLALIFILRSFKVEKNSYTKEPLIITASTLLHVKGGVWMTFQDL